MSIQLQIHKTSEVNALNQRLNGKIFQMLQEYEKSIGGIDQGWKSLLSISDRLILIFEGGLFSEHLIGFYLATTRMAQNYFKGEKVLVTNAVFLEEAKRSPLYILGTVKPLIELLIRAGFNRLDLINRIGHAGLVTEKGYKFAGVFAKLVWNMYGKGKDPNAPRPAGDQYTIILTPQAYYKANERSKWTPKGMLGRIGNTLRFKK
ncbi:hypothetical protein HYV83_00985 [Candidatus Woesearchaeota archaeon]|nr:hypothetical protein [Candidatus Woesearchaeota archaeon]